METQKIIITGGATRIGAAIAEDLANDKNQITIHYNKSKKKAEKLKSISAFYPSTPKANSSSTIKPIRAPSDPFTKTTSPC